MKKKGNTVNNKKKRLRDAVKKKVVGKYKKREREMRGKKRARERESRERRGSRESEEKQNRERTQRLLEHSRKLEIKKRMNEDKGYQ